MSKPSSPQENSLKKHVHGLLLIIVRLKMLRKRYRSAQMTRRFLLAPFAETKSKERRCNVMALYDV